jgi:hypothetical protein
MGSLATGLVTLYWKKKTVQASCSCSAHPCHQVQGRQAVGRCLRQPTFAVRVRGLKHGAIRALHAGPAGANAAGPRTPSPNRVFSVEPNTPEDPSPSIELEPTRGRFQWPPNALGVAKLEISENDGTLTRNRT